MTGKRNRADGPVAYVLRKFPVLSETFVLGEILALEERGVPIHIFSLQRPNDPRFHNDLPKLKAPVSYVPELPAWRKLLRHNRRVSGTTGKAYRDALLFALTRGKPDLWWRFLQSGYVANEARRLGVRHFHAQFANRPTSVAFLASRITGIPFSFTAHATDIFKSRVDIGALARKVDAARFVVTVSDFNKSYLERVTRPDEGKIVRLYNGIDLDMFSPNGIPEPEPFRILCVARLVEKKGLRHLIEALHMLHQRGVRFRADIVGKGMLRPELRARIKAAGLTREVHLVGPKNQREVLTHYHRSHLYVLPAIVGSDGNREGLPVSIVEALACGLPVVTTPITGIPEVIRDEENGLLVPPGDAVALAGALERVIRNPDVYRRLRDRARASVVTDFDRKQTSKALHELLEGSSP